MLNVYFIIAHSEEIMFKVLNGIKKLCQDFKAIFRGFHGLENQVAMNFHSVKNIVYGEFVFGADPFVSF